MQILIHGLDVWNPTTKTSLDNMRIECHRNEIKSLISSMKLHIHLSCSMARRSWMILLVCMYFNHCFIMALSSYFMGNSTRYWKLSSSCSKGTNISMLYSWLGSLYKMWSNSKSIKQFDCSIRVHNPCNYYYYYNHYGDGVLKSS